MAHLLNDATDKNANVTLVEALDKVLERGAVINGDLVSS